MLKLITLLCTLSNTDTMSCIEKTEACYHRQVEISDEKPVRIAILCYETYMENEG